MTDKNSPPSMDGDTQNAFDFAMAVQPLMSNYSDFVVACAFGWLLGQRAMNEAQLSTYLRDVKGAAQASLWGREDNGLV